MSRKRRQGHVEGWGIHNAVIHPDPVRDALLAPRPVVFTNSCTGEQTEAGTHPIVSTQRMEIFQREHALSLAGYEFMRDAVIRQPVSRDWAHASAADIIRDIQEWKRKVENGEVYSLAGPWDYLDYRPL